MAYRNFEITLKIYIVWLQFEEEARKTMSAGRGQPVADAIAPLHPQLLQYGTGYVLVQGHQN